MCGHVLLRICPNIGVCAIFPAESCDVQLADYENGCVMTTRLACRLRQTARSSECILSEFAAMKIGFDSEMGIVGFLWCCLEAARKPHHWARHGAQRGKSTLFCVSVIRTARPKWGCALILSASQFRKILAGHPKAVSGPQAARVGSDTGAPHRAPKV